jgi:hypothetical protein
MRLPEAGSGAKDGITATRSRAYPIKVNIPFKKPFRKNKAASTWRGFEYLISRTIMRKFLLENQK